MPSELNDAQLLALRKTFDSFDTDGSGTLDHEQVASVVRAIGVALTAEEVAAMIHAADGDKSGSIDFKEFEIAIKQTLESARKDGRLGSFGALVSSKAKTGPPMRWVSSKLGNGMSITDGGATVSRSTPDGWGIQLLDQFLANAGGSAYNVGEVMFEVEQVTDGNLHIGVVGRNFWPSAWDVPLTKTHHAVVVEASKGTLTRKTIKCDLILGKIEAGQRVHVVVEMLKQSLTLELLSSDNALVRSVTIGDIPSEVAVAVAMGPGEQKIRLVGSSTDMEEGQVFTGKVHKDLWDIDNRQHLDMQAKKDNPNSLAAVAASTE
jgi:hypothetical protein